jgi:ABC-type antimicrobial peptide transport system permease subunit
MVVRSGLTLTGLGLVIGLAVAFALTRTVAGFLYGVSPADPVTFVVISASTSVVALMASIVPAWRAACVDPMSALRDQ